MSCPQCDQDFFARNVRQIYCSASCRVTACQKRTQSKKITDHNVRQSQHWLPDPIPAPPPWRFHEVPVAIVAHPHRHHHLDELVAATTAEAVILDNQDFGCEVNHLRAWEWLAGGNCPWSVVIEDDALPVQRFRFQLHAALKVAPTPIVSLYLGRSRPPHWQESIAQSVGKTRLEDACFLTASALLHGVGYAIRTALIPDLLASLPGMIKDTPIDEAISSWARQRDYGISYTWPSLLDHRDEGTLIDHPDGHPRTKPRKAWCADWRERWESTTVEIPTPKRLRAVG